MIDFRGLPLPVNLVVLLVSAAIVWGAGTRLARIVDAISERTGLGRAFAGFLLLGGVTSLPELATVITAAHAGHANLALAEDLRRRLARLSDDPYR